MGEAFIEVLREETRLPRASTQEGKDLEGEKSAVRIKSSSPTGLEGRDCPPKKAKMNVQTIALVFRVRRLLLNRFIGSFLTPRIVLSRRIRIALLTW